MSKPGSLPLGCCRVASTQKRINPRRLRREIYALIDHLFSLPNATPGVTEDVRLTLRSHLGVVKK